MRPKVKKRITAYGLIFLAFICVKIYIDSGACEAKATFKETQMEMDQAISKLNRALGKPDEENRDKEGADWLICLPF